MIIGALSVLLKEYLTIPFSHSKVWIFFSFGELTGSCYITHGAQLGAL